MMTSIVRNVFALLLICTFSKHTACLSVTKVSFQADGMASVDSMLNINTGALLNMTQVTICSRIFLQQSNKDDNTITSYFTYQDNEIWYGMSWRTKYFEFQCCQSRVKILKVVPMALRKWHHTCLAVNLETRKYWLAFDDFYIEDNLPPVSPGPLFLQGGGRLVVGQDLDTVDGDFSVHQAFTGDIAQYQIFSTALDPSYVKGYVKCQIPNVSVKPVLSFDENVSAFEIRGSILVSEVPLEELCKRKSSLLMLPEKRTVKESQDACSRMKSTLATPKSDTENRDIWDNFQRFQDNCFSAYSTIFWNGIKGDLASGKWFYLPNTTEITWDNFALGFDDINEERQCVSMGGSQFPYQWFNSKCDIKICTLCNVTDIVPLNVRGLCKETLTDQFLQPYEDNGIKPVYYGTFYTVIYFNNDSLVWTMTHRVHEDFLGIMEMTLPDEYPIGVKTWNITGNKCSENPVKVLISACGANEYTCDDGSCIQKYQRCNMNADCPDQSDETGCNLIETPTSYSNTLPPPQMKEGVPIEIELFTEIMSVREMDILGFKIALDINIELRWRDRRLRMKNLRSSTKANKVQDPEEIWLPTLRIKDGSGILVDILPRSKSLMIKKTSEPIPDDNSILHEDDIYLGSDNTLLLREVDTVGFTCRFELRRYPFDTQRCSLTFSLVDVSTDFVILTRDGIGVEYTGMKWLTEYQVTMVNMTLLKTENDTEIEQKMEIELQNLYGYYISSTYIPTFLLVIISYLTFFFDLEDFTDRVMVSLTSLLVLSSLFAQTSENTPKTAYLKLIDLWFVCLIVVQFLVVVSLVVIENIRLKKLKNPFSDKTFITVLPLGGDNQQNIPKKINGSPIPSAKESNDQQVFPKALKTNSTIRLTVPVFVMIFIFVYIGYCSETF